MAKRTSGKQSVIGAVGGVLIGAAILLFVTIMVLNALKSSAQSPFTHGATYTTVQRQALDDWNATNATINQLKTFMTVCAVLLGILGIVLIGATIIGAIGGGFGG